VNCWYNVENYSCTKIRNDPRFKPGFIPARYWPLTTAIFRFKNDDIRPVTLEYEGLFLQPNKKFETDKMSNPARGTLPHDRYEIEAIVHDSPYQRLEDHGAGYWIARTIDGPFVFEPFDRKTVDEILRDSMQIPIRADWNEDAQDYVISDRQHATKAMALTVYAAVRAFGPRWEPELRTKPPARAQ
jgi:hypothetical protein